MINLLETITPFTICESTKFYDKSIYYIKDRKRAGKVMFMRDTRNIELKNTELKKSKSKNKPPRKKESRLIIEGNTVYELDESCLENGGDWEHEK